MANPNDAVRDAILRSLYAIHQKAKSPRSASVGIRDLQTSLKLLSFKQQEVASNLDYLIQKGWAVEVVEERSFVTPRGTRQPSQKVTYKISDLGIDKLEGASTYDRPVMGGINVTTINGVTVVGDGNVVNAALAPASAALSDLRALILQTDTLTPEQRLNAAADIDSLQGQLQKPRPTLEVIRNLWTSIDAIAVIGGFIEAAERTRQLLAPVLG